MPSNDIPRTSVPRRALAVDQLIVIVFVASLATALGLLALGGLGLRRQATRDLAAVEARQQSELVFETLYAAMARGWEQDEIDEILRRLMEANNGIVVHVHRGKAVVQQFGERDTEHHDSEVLRALATGTEVLFERADLVRFVYPVVFEPSCLDCHTMASAGDVSGVIDVAYRADQVKISLSYVLRVIGVGFSIFLALLFGALHHQLRFFLVRPIVDLVRMTREAVERSDGELRLPEDHRLLELAAMASSFNRLLDSVRDMGRRVHDLAIYDPLTGLQNRSRFANMLNLELVRAEHTSGVTSVLKIDVDEFKHINDAYGHATGDLVLKKVAERLTGRIRDCDMLARVGGDEFALILPGKGPDQALEVAKELHEMVCSAPFEVVSHSLHVRCSVGMASFPQDAADARGLLVSLDLAVREAKSAGKNRVAVAGAGWAESAAHDFGVAQAVQEAMVEERLEPVFQAIVDVRTGEPYGWEVLARLRFANSLVGAQHFIDAVDAYNLGRELDLSMLRRVLRLRREEPELVGRRIFVNLSPSTLTDTDHMDRVLQEHREAGGTLEGLVFEITEREVLPDSDATVAFLRRLKAEGVRYALDDFGSGYSTFAYLKHDFVDYVKIDGALCRHAHNNERDRLVLRHINEVVHDLGLMTVAEHVDTPELLALLGELGVDLAQGHHLARPVRLANLAETHASFIVPPQV